MHIINFKTQLKENLSRSTHKSLRLKNATMHQQDYLCTVVIELWPPTLASFPLDL